MRIHQQRGHHDVRDGMCHQSGGEVWVVVENRGGGEWCIVWEEVGEEGEK